MEKTIYLYLKRRLVEMGYTKEIEWQRDLQPCNNNIDFASEAIWVILNSGMKEQIARKISERIWNAIGDGKDISEVFKHKGKVAAIKHVLMNSGKLFDGYVLTEDKLVFLKTIPFIGEITCYHLAKNLGHDVVKPDRHLVRIAAGYEMSPDELCKKLRAETGDKVCVVDIVLWRAANLKLI